MIFDYILFFWIYHIIYIFFYDIIFDFILVWHICCLILLCYFAILYEPISFVDVYFFKKHRICYIVILYYIFLCYIFGMRMWGI